MEFHPIRVITLRINTLVTNKENKIGIEYVVVLKVIVERNSD